MKNQMMKGGEQIMPMKAIIYCRVATREQTHRFSIEKQRLECLTFAERNGYEVVDTFCELGSGIKINRELERIIQRIKSGAINTIISFSPDRISRSIQILANTIKDVDSVGGEIRFVKESSHQKSNLKEKLKESAAQFS